MCGCLAKYGCTPISTTRILHTIALYFAPCIIYLPAAYGLHFHAFTEHSITASETTGEMSHGEYSIISMIPIYCVAPIIYLALSFLYYKVKGKKRTYLSHKIIQIISELS